MSRHITHDTLHNAARTQRGFGYLVGVTGSAAGAIFLVQDRTLVAAAIWAATFVFGAVLIGLSVALDGLATVLARTIRTVEPPDVDGKPA